jgi:hypothetical protein
MGMAQVYALDVGYDNSNLYGVRPEPLEVEVGDNISINVNSSDYWNTASLGALGDANSTHFESIGGTLTMAIDWLTSFIIDTAPATTPAGNDGNIQYNDGGSFGGDGNFTWDNTNKVLILGNDTSSNPAETKLYVTNTDPTEQSYAHIIGYSGSGFIFEDSQSGGEAGALLAGGLGVGFNFADTGNFRIQTQTKEQILINPASGTELFSIAANGDTTLIGSSSRVKLDVTQGTVGDIQTGSHIAPDGTNDNLNIIADAGGTASNIILSRYTGSAWESVLEYGNLVFDLSLVKDYGSVIIGGGFGSSGITMNSSGHLSMDGNFTGNQIYGEIWGKDVGVVSLSAGIYTNVTNITYGLINGMTQNITENSDLTIQVGGVYQVTSQWSFSGSATNEYHLSLTINHIQQDKCHSERKIGTGGDVGSASFTCFIDVSVGDYIIPVIENVGASNSATIHDLQLNLVRIGN